MISKDASQREARFLVFFQKLHRHLSLSLSTPLFTCIWVGGRDGGRRGKETVGVMLQNF